MNHVFALLMILSWMCLAPSRIHYTDSDDGMSLDLLDREVDAIIQEFSHRRKLPKLQVAENEGQFYSLNNTQLHLCRRLEAEGQIKTVNIQKVPLKKIPQNIQKMMTSPTDQAKSRIEDSQSSEKSNVDDSAIQSTVHDTKLTEDQNGGFTFIALDSDAESVDSVHKFSDDSTDDSSTDASTESELEDDDESCV